MEYTNGYQDPVSLFVILAKHMLLVFAASHNSIHSSLSHWCPVSAKKHFVHCMHMLEYYARKMFMHACAYACKMVMHLLPATCMGILGGASYVYVFIPQALVCQVKCADCVP